MAEASSLPPSATAEPNEQHYEDTTDQEIGQWPPLPNKLSSSMSFKIGEFEAEANSVCGGSVCSSF